MKSVSRMSKANARPAGIIGLTKTTSLTKTTKTTGWGGLVATGAAMGLLAVVGCAVDRTAGSDSVIAEDTSTIIGGESDTGDPSVVAVYAQQPGQPGGFLCTGSIIAPTVVLTAAHCVSESETGPGATFTVLTSPNINRSGAHGLAVREVHANPLWSSRRLEAGHDQGVVVLAEPSTLTPLPINRQPLAAALRGGSVRIVGYGLNDGIAQTGAGIKRQALTNLGTISSNLIAVGDARRGTCNGDSGGPAFMSLNGLETIVGTTSYGNADCSDGGYDARIDTDLAFVDRYAQAACAPECSTRVCGSDGCGGSCGTCAPGLQCGEGGQCAALANTCGGSGVTEREPNDSALQANPLCPGNLARGTLTSAADLDWFTWTSTPDSVYDAVLSGSGSTASLRVYKLSATTGRLSFIGDGLEISRHTDTGGTYVARISANAGVTGDYLLQVTLTP